MGRVYLDYAASEPLSDVARESLLRSATDPSFSSFANPNSLHQEGRESFAALQDARERIAGLLDCRPHEIAFTGGATEADNAALLGVAGSYRKKKPNFMPHIVTTSVEHDAVFQCAKQIASLGLAEVSFVDPQTSGHIGPESVAAAVKTNTILVSCIAGHNEYGARNDIAKIAEAAHRGGALAHADCVQLLGKEELSLDGLGVDLASFSAHKVGGPKGVGVLYARGGTNLLPLLAGGGQESGLRSGTQNVAGAVAFADTLESLLGDRQSFERECLAMSALRDALYEGLCSFEGVVPSVPCAPASREYLPHIVNVCVSGIESETLILRLDEAGFSVSGGSACSSHSLEPSRSLLAIGIPRDLALGSLRVSVGRATTRQEVNAFVQQFGEVLEGVREG